jgi:hypothetical protein
MSIASSRAGRHACDQERTARLLFATELAGGEIAADALRSPAVRAATRVPAVPSAGVRFAQRTLRKLGRLGYRERVAMPLQAARTSLLGEHRDAKPRLLVRVDEFPHYQAWDEPRRYGTAAFERFHEIMGGSGVPYLIAALPRVSRQPLLPRALGSRPIEDDEAELLRRIEGEGCELALHGLDHRTRHASPRRHSELCGLDRAQTEALLDRALAELNRHGLGAPRVFVAPYNRFDVAQLEILAERFTVVCGGPESVGTLGFQLTPQWRGETVYLPSYAPFYGRAAEVLAALESGVEPIGGLWTPIVLHWGWEADAGWRELERLAAKLARYAVPWQSFFEAVRLSRGADRLAGA